MPVLTQGDSERTNRTFTVNGATPVFVPDSRLTVNSVVHPFPRTVNGTVAPLVFSVQPTYGTNGGFTVVSSAGNNTTYNYRIF